MHRAKRTADLKEMLEDFIVVVRVPQRRSQGDHDQVEP